MWHEHVQITTGSHPGQSGGCIAEYNHSTLSHLPQHPATTQHQALPPGQPFGAYGQYGIPPWRPPGTYY